MSGLEETPLKGKFVGLEVYRVGYVVFYVVWMEDPTIWKGASVRTLYLHHANIPTPDQLANPPWKVEHVFSDRCLLQEFVKDDPLFSNRDLDTCWRRIEEKVCDLLPTTATASSGGLVLFIPT